jgi:hypothetical protein
MLRSKVLFVFFQIKLWMLFTPESVCVCLVFSILFSPHQILHWQETQKFRYFTVVWHRSWSGRFTYRNRNGCMYVPTQHTLSSCCLDTDFRKRYLGSDWYPVGGSHGGLSHHPPRRDWCLGDIIYTWEILAHTYSHMCTKFGWSRSRHSRVILEHTHPHTYIHLYI